MSRVFIATLALPAACAMMSSSTRVLPPLQDEGALYVEAQPGFSPDFTGASVFRFDGSSVALEFRSNEGKGAVQRLLAEGRLPPGNYEGIALEAKQPARIVAPFRIEARRTVVLQISRRPDGVLTAGEPPKTIVALSGYVSGGASQDLAVFDKHLRQVTSTLPTGRGPWGVALDPISNRAYVALEGEDQVAVVDVASGAEIIRIRLALGDAPREVLLLSDRRTLLTANGGSNTVGVVDVAAMLEIARIPVGDEPTSLLADRKTSRVYVFNARSNSISVLDTVTRTVTATVQTDNTPLRGQLDGAGARLYVASTASQLLLVYALPQLSVVQRVHVGLGTTSLKVDPDTDLIYVANADGRVSIFDPFSLQPVDNFDVNGAARWMAIDAAENVLYLLLNERRSVEAVQLTNKAPVGGFDTGADPRVLVLMGERN